MEPTLAQALVMISKLLKLSHIEERGERKKLSNCAIIYAIWQHCVDSTRYS